MLYQDQQETISEMFKWLDESKKPGFVISGSAGMGKSFSVDEIIKQLREREVTFHLIAPTHKACKVLADFTGKDVDTIHKFMNLRLMFDTDDGEIKTISNNRGGSPLVEGDVLFIDEASMIDGRMLQRIMADVMSKKARAVFIGDAYQIPPVDKGRKDTDAIPVFKQVGTQSFLTTIKRQKVGSPIIEQAESMRAVLDGAEYPFLYTDLNAEGEGVEVVDRAEFDARIISTFKEDEYSDTRIISYTNKNVIKYNKMVREEALGIVGNAPYVGEELVVNTAISNSDDEVVAMTDEAFMVDKVVRGDVEGHKGWFLPTDRKTTPWVSKKQYHFLMNRFGGVPKRNFKFFIPEDWNAIREHTDSLIKEALRIKAFGNRKATAEAWVRMYRFREQFHDLRQPFSLTAHKSQGSSFDTVFIDLDDIGICTHDLTIARLLYVAISRARKNVILTGKLPDRLYK